MTKILIIVPHEDDELSVAGQLLVSLSKYEMNECYVVFATNGDAYPFLGEKRIKEAIKSLRTLGIDEKNIFFLGYGNEWNAKKHIYNCKANQRMVSKGGFGKTYSILEHPEYSYLKYGIHHLYTRENLKNDLLGLLYDIEPSFIVCVDYDSHVDHRAVSLLFEECIGDIMKNRQGYRPVVWKKFGYLGAWDGPKDYYQHAVTQNSYDCEDTDNPIFQWSDRIRLQVDDSCKTRFLHNNIIYKAALCYKTQNAWLNVQKLCNEDVVYWRRNTDNLMLCANVSAKSGNYRCLNDFIITNSADIGEKKFITDDTTLWHPTDAERQVLFEFERPVSAKSLIFYESPLPEDHIRNITVNINDRYSFSTGDLNRAGKASVYQMDYDNISKIEIKIEEWEGSFPGLSEIELLNIPQVEQLPDGIMLYEEHCKKNWGYEKILLFVEYWILRLKAFLTTLLFPNYYIMAKKYPIMQRHKIFMPLYWVINWMKR